MKKQTAFIYGTILVAFSVTAANSSAAQGYCNGIAYPCSNYDRNQERCLQTAGCTYIMGSIYDKSCIGQVVQCDKLKNLVNNEQAHKTLCSYQVGCYWVEQPNL